MTAFALLRHLAFCAALACVSALVVRGMIAAGLMDQPDARKLHAVPIPRGGGVGIVVAFLLGIMLLYGFAEFARIAAPYFQGVIVAALGIALVGLLDDWLDWPFAAKLAAQLAAAGLAVGSGLTVRALHLPWFGTVEADLWGVPITLLWLLFVTNAVNFIDGMNGLAAGTSLVAAFFLAAIAATQGAWFAYFAGLLLAAGIAGFLPFNFPRARIFMGDVGSQFCGFMLGVLGIAAARFERVELSFLLVPMLLSGVLWDVAFTLLRRGFAGENLARAHRGHLYQLAQRSGMDARLIAMLHWGFTGLGGIAVFALMALPESARPLAPLALLVPQIWWTLFVLQRARHAPIGAW